MDTLSVAAVRAFDPHHSVLKTIDALNPDVLRNQALSHTLLPAS